MADVGRELAGDVGEGEAGVAAGIGVQQGSPVHAATLGRGEHVGIDSHHDHARPVLGTGDGAGEGVVELVGPVDGDGVGAERAGERSKIDEADVDGPGAPSAPSAASAASAAGVAGLV